MKHSVGSVRWDLLLRLGGRRDVLLLGIGMSIAFLRGVGVLLLRMVFGWEKKKKKKEKEKEKEKKHELVFSLL